MGILKELNRLIKGEELLTEEDKFELKEIKREAYLQEAKELMMKKGIEKARRELK